MSGKVAVFGSSGFVGATLVERLREAGKWEVVPVIHSSGNAWRLARLGIRLFQVDLLESEQLRAVLAGCTHVVNCTRGGEEVMLRGLRNLLEASKARDVSRFVHLSSVAVYGDPPPRESVHESAPTRPEKGSYGWLKLQQDQMVAGAARDGLSSVALCPPNITGAYSGYLLEVLNTLREGRFAFLDGGNTVCNTVDVHNLCHAIELSLTTGPTDGSRLFITDGEEVLWRDIVDHMRQLDPRIQNPPEVTRRKLEVSVSDRRPSVWAAVKHLVSSDVRQALRKDPLLARGDQLVRGIVSKLGRHTEEKLRHSIEGALPVPSPAGKATLHFRLCRQQLRGVYHSNEQAGTTLGYRPVFSVGDSMDAFRSWYRDLHGWGLLAGDLVRAWGD